MKKQLDQDQNVQLAKPKLTKAHPSNVKQVSVAVVIRKGSEAACRLCHKRCVGSRVYHYEIKTTVFFFCDSFFRLTSKDGKEKGDI